MKTPILALLAAFLLTPLAHAEMEIPQCWNDQQTGQKVIEGNFHIELPTSNHSALDVANFIEALSDMSILAVGNVSDNEGVRISIQAESPDIGLLSHVKGKPNLTVRSAVQSLRETAMADLQKALKAVPDATVRCFAYLPANTNPGVRVSN
jgi:hypothetical protein